MKDPQYQVELEEDEPRRHGCLFYGCITLIVLAVLALIMLFLIYRWWMQQVNQYTDDKPVTFPQLTMPAEEQKEVKKRFDDFITAVKEGKETEPLVLTSDDCNALIQGSEEGELRDRVHINIEGDAIKGQVSLPLNELPLPGMSGRYLNAEAAFKVSLENGVLIATIDQASVKGKPLPPQFIEGMRSQNLAKDAYKDPENAEAIAKLESIQVKDGKIIVKARKPSEKKEGEEKAKAGEDEGKPKDEDKAKAEDQDKDREKPADKDADKPAEETDKPRDQPAEPKAAA